MRISNIWRKRSARSRKNKQLNIERAQRSLVNDTRAIVRSNDIKEVRTVTASCNIRAAKRRADVSPTIYYISRSIFCVSHSIFVSAIFCVSDIFVCRPFFLCQALFVCHPFYYLSPICASHFILYASRLT
jgi:hypothetical protein